MKDDQYTDITSQIIAELENGTAPWVKPWADDPAAKPSIPYNATTHREYSGVNVLALWTAATMRGYGPGGWLTFKQALDCGGHVRRGERGSRVFKMGTVTKEKDNGDEETFSYLRKYTVFHVSQTAGLPEHMHPAPAPLPPEPERIARAESFISAARADLHHGGNRAFYQRAGDFIQLPHAAQFGTVQDYYAASLHEHAHWTGAPHRLDREKGKRFGDHAYAFEELVAELTAAFLCAHLGITGKLQHAEYLGHWARLLGDHKRALFSAAAKASQAADFLRQFSEIPAAVAAE